MNPRLTKIIKLFDWSFSSRALFVVIVPWLIVITVLIAPALLEIIFSWRWTGLHDFERMTIIIFGAIVSVVIAFLASMERFV